MSSPVALIDLHLREMKRVGKEVRPVEQFEQHIPRCVAKGCKHQRPRLPEATQIFEAIAGAKQDPKTGSKSPPRGSSAPAVVLLLLRVQLCFPSEERAYEGNNFQSSQQRRIWSLAMQGCTEAGEALQL